jgi:hypothetical protein
MIARPTQLAALAALATLAALVVASPATTRAQRLPAQAEWRAARWGMTVDEVLKAFPGEAKRLETPLPLADGNVVAAGIEKHALGGTTFRVRFVFDAAGGLVLVSLRTPETEYAKAEAIDAVEKALSERLGPPTWKGTSSEFVDMRQTTWKVTNGRVDIKYIPGVIVVMHAAPSQQPPVAAPASKD